MSILSQRALGALAAAGAMSFSFGAAVHAQPADQYPSVGGLVVTAPYHYRRAFNGAPIETVRASRVVEYGDLDLSAPWGRHELRARIWRAAVADCDELDNSWTQGLYPTGDNGPCVRPTVRRAMYQVYGGGPYAPAYGAAYGGPYDAAY